MEKKSRVLTKEMVVAQLGDALSRGLMVEVRDFSAFPSVDEIKEIAEELGVQASLYLISYDWEDAHKYRLTFSHPHHGRLYAVYYTVSIPGSISDNDEEITWIAPKKDCVDPYLDMVEAETTVYDGEMKEYMNGKKG